MPFAFEVDPQIVYDAGKARDYTGNHRFKTKCWSITDIIDSISNNYKANCQMILIYVFLLFTVFFFSFWWFSDLSIQIKFLCLCFNMLASDSKPLREELAHYLRGYFISFLSDFHSPSCRKNWQEQYF